VVGFQAEDAEPPDPAIYDSRVRLFLVDNERDKSVTVAIGAAQHTVGPSEANGHFRATVTVPVSEVEATDAWLEVTVVDTGAGGTRTGRVQLVPPVGLSVISDIDDTIKITGVTDKAELLANTFDRELREAPGMADLYRGAVQDRELSFHYVSSSPWQLYEPLTAFMTAAGFPAATLNLKQFRVKDSSFLELFGDPLEAKPAVIEPILGRYPGRRFLLVGDSGEKDPEVYGLVARRHPDQVVGILIRDVTEEAPDAPRFQAAFQEVPAEKWRVFTDPAELDLAQWLTEPTSVP